MNNINVWDLGSEVENKPRIPTFAKSKYMVLKVVPPKGKTVRDGLVMHAALISYEDKDGNEIKVTNVTEGTSGYEVEFPLGKYLVLATKYRGPKSWYNFVHPVSGKWTRIPQEKFSLSFANEYVKSHTENWDQLDDTTKEQLVDDYFEKMYTFGLACDFNLDTSEEDFVTPKPGMVTHFYRRYTPPKEDEKYGNTIITKWPSRRIDAEKDFEALDGSYEMVNSEVAEAIITALSENDNQDKKFDPTKTDSTEIPF